MRRIISEPDCGARRFDGSFQETLHAMFALLARPRSGDHSPGSIKGCIGQRLNGKYLISINHYRALERRTTSNRNFAVNPHRNFSAAAISGSWAASLQY
jgi:hypothetical protein